MNEPVPFEKLQLITGYDRPSDVRKCLKSQGVTVLRGKSGKPFTTMDALNRAMGIDPTSEPEPQEEIEFE